MRSLSSWAMIEVEKWGLCNSGRAVGMKEKKGDLCEAALIAVLAVAVAAKWSVSMEKS